jgi:hypothetical protein
LEQRGTLKSTKAAAMIKSAAVLSYAQHFAKKVEKIQHLVWTFR